MHERVYEDFAFANKKIRKHNLNQCLLLNTFAIYTDFISPIGKTLKCFNLFGIACFINYDDKENRFFITE